MTVPAIEKTFCWAIPEAAALCDNPQLSLTDGMRASFVNGGTLRLEFGGDAVDIPRGELVEVTVRISKWEGKMP